MPIVVKPEFNWGACCLEQDYITWHNTVKDNSIVHESKKAHMACYARDKGRWYGNSVSYEIWMERRQTENYELV